MKPGNRKKPEDVGIVASVRAKELLVKAPVRTSVRFSSSGEVSTERTGIPEDGAAPGVTYQHVEIRTRIVDRLKTH